MPPEIDDLIVFSVLEVTQHLKQVIETQIEPLYVRGEISNFTHHTSGHMYFNLKDPGATLRCTFFRNLNLYLGFKPEEGMEVICFGNLTVWEKGGSYNLNVHTMRLAGQGDLARKFSLLKGKLEAEGLFAPEHKQPLPRYPKRLGIVTSPTGAALQDILNILGRRYPLEVEVYPALVQGEEAPAQLIAGLQHFNAEGRMDVIILARGGGSQEDLFCFNDEALARAIFASVIPVVSAVGHEIDFTIADFVADLRAPTPSAAAELVVPDRQELQAYLASLEEALQTRYAAKLDRCRHNYIDAQLRFSRFHPEKAWQQLQMRLDLASIELLKSVSRLQTALHNGSLRQTMALNQLQSLLQADLQRKKQRLIELRPALVNAANTLYTAIRHRLDNTRMQLLERSPKAILNRGFSIVVREGKIVSSVTQVAELDELRLRLRDGSAAVQVLQIEADDGFLADE